MHPKNISIKDFTYSLPEEKIAHYPLDKRDSSKLLIYKEGDIGEDIYSNIDTHLPPGSLLIFNNTKVVEARLLFQKPTGGIIEIFCLEPHEQYGDINVAMLQQEKVFWKCLVGGASKWKRGQVLEKIIKNEKSQISLRAVYTEKRTDHFIIEFSWTPVNISFAEILHAAGAIPLPPYIKRKAEASDAERYQTIYAQWDGSVAAPTAGLHFTQNIFEKLQKKNIQTDFVTLHVGAGTFKPVKTETMETHEMHAEFIDVSINTIENILANIDKNIVAVGTTSVRTLESLYWLGVKTVVIASEAKQNSRQSSLRAERSKTVGIASEAKQNSQELKELYQWDAYDMAEQNIPVKEALQSLLDWMKEKKMERLLTKTQIIIAPGYKPRIVKAIVTNFHQPNSTLLLLVSALIGNDWKKVYDYALQNNFRFLSYGDGCLLWACTR